MWSRVKAVNEIVSSWKSRRGPGGSWPESVPFQRRSNNDDDDYDGIYNAVREAAGLIARAILAVSRQLPIACINRVNEEVNDGEEVLIINDSDNGRGMHALRREASFCNPRNARPPTQFNLPKYIHYLRQSLVLRCAFVWLIMSNLAARPSSRLSQLRN